MLILLLTGAIGKRDLSEEELRGFLSKLKDKIKDLAPIISTLAPLSVGEYPLVLILTMTNVKKFAPRFFSEM